MCDLTLYRDGESGNSFVSNLFIDKFLSDANDAQIKVYLYLIRMTGANRATNISDMADKFNHTEKDVCRALRYWEKKGLLSLDYDKNGGIVGIRLHDPVADKAASSPKMPDADTVAALPSAKPSYSLDELKAFKNRQDTPRLIFIAEQYLKKTLSASDIRSILFYTDELNFSADLIDYLLQYAVEHGKANFKYMDRVAADWAEHGIFTVKEARAYTLQYEGGALKPSGSRRTYAGSSKKPLTAFHNFEQPDYDFEEIERIKLGIQ